MSPTQRRLFGLLATVALVAAACSSGGGSPSPAAVESTAASAPAAIRPGVRGPERQRSRRRRDHGDAGRVGQDAAAAEVHGRGGVRPGQRGRAGSARRAPEPGRAVLHRPRPGVERPGRPGRVRHERAHAGLQRADDLEQLGRPDRARGEGRGGWRDQGRDLGLADPLRRGREPVRRPGRLRRDRRGHGRHGPRDPRRGRRRVRRPVGDAGCGQPERVDRLARGDPQGSEVRQP